ncbi:ATP-dependent DNA helicase PIF1 [Linum grandiflorum]
MESSVSHLWGGKVDHKLNDGSGVYIYSIGGQIFHRIGSLIPPEGQPPVFCQLYIHDTDNEIMHRLNSFSADANTNPLRQFIIQYLSDMLDEHNVLVKVFRYARNRMNVADVHIVKLKLLASKSGDGREYDLPTVDEVAALIVDETGGASYQLDVVVEHQSSELQRIIYKHPSIMALQYPLLFPYGEDGWHPNIPLQQRSSVLGDSEIEIPRELKVHRGADPIAAIANSTYDNIVQYYGDQNYFADRAVVAPFHDNVSLVNDYMLQLFPGEEVCYHSSDSIQFDAIDQIDTDAEFPPEFLNNLKIGNFPDHELKLKVGIPVILLRNIDQAAGLCNGTRLIIRTMGKWSIEVEIVTGTNVGDRVYLPRITMSSEQKSLNFTLLRRQYPIALCFAMTINKSQGQTLKKVGICLTRQVFTHGELYVALSRVTTKASLQIISCDEAGSEKNSMKNIVFREILN